MGIWGFWCYEVFIGREFRGRLLSKVLRFFRIENREGGEFYRKLNNVCFFCYRIVNDSGSKFNIYFGYFCGTVFAYFGGINILGRIEE